jgi:cytochrome c oxidase cbb3-type subunit 3
MDLRPLGLLLLACGCGRGRDDDVGGAPPSIAYDQHVSAGERAPAGATMTNPLTADSATAAEGGQIFGAMNCDGCHGGGGTGWVGPSLADGRWRYGGTDGALFQSIYYGRPRGMPAYGGIMSTGAIWKVVAYINAQPVPATVPTQAWLDRPPTEDRPEREKTTDRP